MMKCPDCHSTKFGKNGRRKNNQKYLCRTCRRQLIDTSEPKG